MAAAHSPAEAVPSGRYPPLKPHTAESQALPPLPPHSLPRLLGCRLQRVNKIHKDAAKSSYGRGQKGAGLWDSLELRLRVW